MAVLEFKVDAARDMERLDVFLHEAFGEREDCAGGVASRSFFQKRIKDGGVAVDGKPQKANYRVREGERVSVEIPDPAPAAIAPEDIPLDILYEDEDLLVVNKPKGMVVHPSAGHPGGTLANAVMFHCRDSLSGINGETRPGIVHRIDRDTTGSIVVCKNDESHLSIARQLKEHTVTRSYRGIVIGNVKDDEGTVDAPLGRHRADRKKRAVDFEGGKRAVTHYKVLERFGQYTYMEFRLETGRTHQIRAHMAYIGHPLLGDATYSGAKCPFAIQGQALHAMTIGFMHPRTGEYLEVTAPLPEYFESLLVRLRGMAR